MVKKKLLSFVAFYASKYNRVSSYLWDVWRREKVSFFGASSGENKAEYSEKRPAGTKKVVRNDNYQTLNTNDVWGQMERF